MRAPIVGAVLFAFVVPLASSATTPAAPARCSPLPQVAARFIVPPPPFVARVISVTRQSIPAGEPTAGGPNLKRLYRVSFYAVKGNAVLPTGHR